MNIQDTFSVSANVQNWVYFWRLKKKLLKAMKKCFVMSPMFKTKLELLLLPLEHAQTRYDVGGGDCQWEISLIFKSPQSTEYPTLLLNLLQDLLIGTTVGRNPYLFASITCWLTRSFSKGSYHFIPVYILSLISIQLELVCISRYHTHLVLICPSWLCFQPFASLLLTLNLWKVFFLKICIVVFFRSDF